MEMIGISPRFFKHELNNYSEWQRAFWRELVQNSVDEKSSKISVTIEPKDFSGKQGCAITFYDNGPGMSEITLRNVYFQLGATGKEGVDTIGGHGRARILTCFAHERYSIRTQTLLCHGEGGSFKIENDHSYVKGCSVYVEMSEANAPDMEEYLRDYLSLCQLPCEITINGAPYTNWLYRRKATRQLTFGTVHTTKQKPYCAIVRVRGVSMFSRYISSETGAILEIDPTRSRELLTVSRDHLKYENQRELDDFINEITIDNRSLSRDCSVNKTEIYGRFKKILKKGDNKLEAEEEKKALALGESSTTYHDSGLASAALYEGKLGEHLLETVEGLDFSKTSSDPFGDSLPWKEYLKRNFAVHYEDTPRDMVSSAKRFHKENISGNRLKLLAAWDATCSFFLESLSEIYECDETAYLPGFVFGVGIGGLHQKKDEGHILYMNPLDSNGNIGVSCKDFAKLFSLGAHEVSHTRFQFHNEDYANTLTTLVEYCVPKIGELKHRIKQAIEI
jgi:Histidine kinase-, DNA gyrase B-, and HSP90-like ATPase